jgi:hypothetical protein
MSLAVRSPVPTEKTAPTAALLANLNPMQPEQRPLLRLSTSSMTMEGIRPECLTH